MAISLSKLISKAQIPFSNSFYFVLWWGAQQQGGIGVNGGSPLLRRQRLQKAKMLISMHSDAFDRVWSLNAFRLFRKIPKLRTIDNEIQFP